MRKRRFVLWIALAALYAAVGWLAGLVALAVVVVVTALFLWRLRRALSPTLRCPRGHVVPTYGRYACGACGAETMSSAWRCRWCGARFGHVRCPTCGLSVGNPLLGG